MVSNEIVFDATGNTKFGSLCNEGPNCRWELKITNVANAAECAIGVKKLPDFWMGPDWEFELKGNGDVSVVVDRTTLKTSNYHMIEFRGGAESKVIRLNNNNQPKVIVDEIEEFAIPSDSDSDSIEFKGDYVLAAKCGEGTKIEIVAFEKSRFSFYWSSLFGIRGSRSQIIQTRSFTKGGNVFRANGNEKFGGLCKQGLNCCWNVKATKEEGSNPKCTIGLARVSDEGYWISDDRQFIRMDVGSADHYDSRYDPINYGEQMNICLYNKDEPQILVNDFDGIPISVDFGGNYVFAAKCAGKADIEINSFIAKDDDVSSVVMLSVVAIVVLIMLLFGAIRFSRQTTL